MSLRFAFIWLALWAVVVSPAAARELYVSNVAGDDRSDGRTGESTDRSGPVRTIGRALALARPGDHIIVAKTTEPYREGISLSSRDHSGFSVRPFVIEGNGAVLDGTARVPDGAWENVRDDLYKFRPAGGGNLRLFQDNGKPVDEKPVDAAVARLPQLAPRQWCAHGGYVYFQCEPGKLPRQYSLSYAKLPVGITLYHVHDVRIVDLTVQGFQRDGVNAHDGVRNAALGGLILRGNGRSGLAVGGSSQVEADGCLIGNNGQAQVIVEGTSAVSLKQCEVLANPAPALQRRSRGERVFINGVKQE